MAFQQSLARRVWNRLRRWRFGYSPSFDPYVIGENRSSTTVGLLDSPPGDNALRDIFMRSDRGDIHKWHHYFEVYDRFFSRFRDRADLRFLEIGVFRGGSLRLWRSYFHKDALIVGLDIDDDCAKFANPALRTHVAIGDQSDKEFLRSVIKEFGPFDIIIDDGGHMTSQMIDSFNVLYPEGLADQGVYLVEDCQTNYWRGYRDTRRSFVDVAKNLTDRLHEPYYRLESEVFFRKGHEKQVRSAELSHFGANTFAISFFDSIVVFEKRRKGLPVSEIR